MEKIFIVITNLLFVLALISCNSEKKDSDTNSINNNIVTDKSVEVNENTVIERFEYSDDLKDLDLSLFQHDSIFIEENPVKGSYYSLIEIYNEKDGEKDLLYTISHAFRGDIYIKDTSIFFTIENPNVYGEASYWYLDLKEGKKIWICDYYGISGIDPDVSILFTGDRDFVNLDKSPIEGHFAAYNIETGIKIKTFDFSGLIKEFENREASHRVIFNEEMNQFEIEYSEEYEVLAVYSIPLEEINK